MKRMLCYLRRWHLRTVACASLLAVGCAQFAFAQQPEEEVVKEKWAMGYFIVVVMIALGLVSVCRPGKRIREVFAKDDES